MRFGKAQNIYRCCHYQTECLPHDLCCRFAAYFQVHSNSGRKTTRWANAQDELLPILVSKLLSNSRTYPFVETSVVPSKNFKIFSTFLFYSFYFHFQSTKNYFKKLFNATLKANAVQITTRRIGGLLFLPKLQATKCSVALVDVFSTEVKMINILKKRGLSSWRWWRQISLIWPHPAFSSSNRQSSLQLLLTYASQLINSATAGLPRLI